MNFLEREIIKRGKVSPDGKLIVDEFMNHMLDMDIMHRIGKTFSGMFDPEKIDRIITLESSGIAPAVITSQYFGNVPVIIAKRRKYINTPDDVFTAYIRDEAGEESRIVLERKTVRRYDRILIIDDILANGHSIKALAELVEAAGAEVRGVGICIERGELSGGKVLREMGLDVRAIATTKKLDPESGKISFK